MNTAMHILLAKNFKNGVSEIDFCSNIDQFHFDLTWLAAVAATFNTKPKCAHSKHHTLWNGVWMTNT